MDGKTDVLIIGAGFAGAATAYHLSASFPGTIWVIEKEPTPGFHASGRNASLLLQSTESPLIRRLSAASRAAYEQHRGEFEFRQNGSLLLGTREQLNRVRDPQLIASQFQTPEEIVQCIPALEGYNFEAGLLTPSDGVIDIAGLMEFYLRGARQRGVRLFLDHEVQSISGDGPFQVDTPSGRFEAGIVVNAAGAWATEVARRADLRPPVMFPFKRHLFILDDVPEISDSHPFVWSLADHFYFRAESGGLLFSICDEESTRSLEPTVNGEIAEELAELIWRHLPALREAVQRRVWSCFRTKTRDEQFVIGWDPSRAHFFWVAGLGGHGMGCSWEVGRLAAAALIDPGYPLPGELRPDRTQAGTGNPSL